MKIGNLLPHALSFYHKVNAGGFFFWVRGYVSISFIMLISVGYLKKKVFFGPLIVSID
jgi:hypothetical protein